MAKAKATEAKSEKSVWEFRTLGHIWNNSKRANVDLAWRLAMSEAVSVKGVIDPWDPKSRRRDKMPVIVGLQGLGKCLGRNTPVLMFDGTIKPVQSVVPGDLLMGPDSTPRTVQSTTTGQEEMVRIVPVKGKSFECNMSHILCLKASSQVTGYAMGEVIEISVRDYLNKPKSGFQNRTMLYHSDTVDFGNNPELPIDPYVLGLWLGDGTASKPEFTINDNDRELDAAITEFADARGLKIGGHAEAGCHNVSVSTQVSGSRNNTFTRDLRVLNLMQNKHIPQMYMTASVEQRKQLLAGILDTDGYLAEKCYTLTMSNQLLVEHIAFVARSLGLMVTTKPITKSCVYKGEVKTGDYYYACISGDTAQIPCKLSRRIAEPRKQIKDPLKTGIRRIEMLGVGDYYGFTLDGDGQFLLGDFLVTHNTSALRQIAASNGFEIAMLEFAGTALEDNLPITLNLLDPETNQPVRRGYGEIYRPPRGKPYGICLVNECLGASIPQQQQLRAFLSNRMLAGVRIDPGWILIGDTNPATAEFMDNRPMTRSMESRCYFIPTDQEFTHSMDYWAGNNQLNHLKIPDQAPREVAVTPMQADGSGGFHESLYMFLRMYGGDSEMSFYLAVDPRRWEMISDSMIRMEAGGLVTQDEILQWMEYVLPEAVVTAYRTFLKKGSDKNEYPIPGHRLFDADKAEHKEHMDRLKKWENDSNRNMLIGFTTFEVLGYLRSRTKLEKHQQNNLKDFMLQVDDTKTANILETVRGEISDVIWTLIYNTPKEKAMQELMRRMEKIGQV